ncbi:hypothetical protein [Sorangium sp. So ce1024]|uniref:hypothetical protein n=1 Tax=Sorangium sp. So ce1024 TaxID=3133327 RepID=UPI003EFFC990
MDIDIRIGRFRLSWSSRSSLMPESAREMERELWSLRARNRHIELQEMDMQDLLRRELRGEPEDKPSPHAAKCAAALIRRLKEELTEERSTSREMFNALMKRCATLAQVADAAGVEQCDELDDNQVVSAVRSLRARTAPLVRSAA